MKELARNFRSLLTLIVTMLGVIGYVVFVFLPGNRAIAKLDDEVSALRGYIRTSSLLLLEIEEIESRMGRIRTVQAEWEKSAGNTATPSFIYGKISTLAEANELKMIQFTPKTPQSMELLEPLGLSLIYTGPFNGVANFLAELEAMPQIVWVDQASVVRQAGGDVQVTLELRVFVDKTDSSS